MVVFGLPGTGKGLVAKQIIERTGGVGYNSDVIRKKLFPNPTYSLEESVATYTEMFSRAEQALFSSKAVVLDATFHRQENRKQAVELSQTSNARLSLIHVTCHNEQLIRKRLINRKQEKNNPSDADWPVYCSIRDRFAPITESHFVIENNAGLEDLDKKTMAMLATLGL